MLMEVFNGKNGRVSSIRSSIRVGNNKVENTTYFNTGKGGVTFRGNYMTSRLNSDGKSLGVGTGIKSKQYYTGRNFTSNIPQFR